ncbi:MAG: elongation factor Ts [Candidatus Blackburnbacteria bacterium]|nr:elongation factor Ts [Candidatus Blackburnbacteria bacterium]
MKVSIEHIKKLREELGVSISDIRYALEESDGNEDKAREFLRKKGLERAEKKSERQIKAGRVFSYIHHTGTLGAMVVLGCETDFVARTDEFQKLGQEIAMQVASLGGENVEEVSKQDYIRDSGKTVEDLIKEVIGKLGENIQLLDLKRLAV